MNTTAELLGQIGARPIDLDRVIQNAVNRIAAMLPHDCASLKPQMQVVVREALHTYMPNEIAMYWYTRATENNNRADRQSHRANRAERALMAANFTDDSIDWHPPKDTRLADMKQTIQHLQNEVHALREANPEHYTIDKAVQLTARPVSGDDPVPRGETSLKFHTFHATKNQVIAAGIKALQEGSRCTVWPARALEIYVQHDSIGDAMLTPLVHAAMVELETYDPKGEHYSFTSSNGVRIRIKPVPMLDNAEDDLPTTTEKVSQ